jgi:hypothetical protein
MKGTFFEKIKIERQLLEADLYLRSDSYLLCINIYFAILRTNSNVTNFQEMPDVYQKCIRIVLNEYARKNGFDVSTKPILESLLDDGMSEGP